MYTSELQCRTQGWQHFAEGQRTHAPLIFNHVSCVTLCSSRCSLHTLLRQALTTQPQGC